MPRRRRINVPEDPPEEEPTDLLEEMNRLEMERDIRPFREIAEKIRREEMDE